MPSKLAFIASFNGEIFLDFFMSVDKILFFGWFRVACWFRVHFPFKLALQTQLPFLRFLFRLRQLYPVTHQLSAIHH